MASCFAFLNFRLNPNICLWAFINCATGTSPFLKNLLLWLLFLKKYLVLIRGWDASFAGWQLFVLRHISFAEEVLSMQNLLHWVANLGCDTNQLKRTYSTILLSSFSQLFKVLFEWNMHKSTFWLFCYTTMKMATLWKSKSSQSISVLNLGVLQQDKIQVQYWCFHENFLTG